MFFLMKWQCYIQIRCDTAHFPFSQVLFPLTSTDRQTVHFAAHKKRRPRVRPCGPKSWSCRSILRLPPPPSSFSPSFAPQAEEDLSSASLERPRTSHLCGRAAIQSSSLCWLPGLLHCHRIIKQLLGCFHTTHLAESICEQLLGCDTMS